VTLLHERSKLAANERKWRKSELLLGERVKEKLFGTLRLVPKHISKPEEILDADFQG